MRRGIPQSAALAFLLAAPAINPVVMVATAVAFPNRPEMVLARFIAALAVAVIVGWLWLRFGKGRQVLPPRRHEQDSCSRLETFRSSTSS